MVVEVAGAAVAAEARVEAVVAAVEVVVVVVVAVVMAAVVAAVATEAASENIEGRGRAEDGKRKQLGAQALFRYKTKGISIQTKAECQYKAKGFSI